MKTKEKQVLSILIAICIVFTSAPTPVYSAELADELQKAEAILISDRQEEDLTGANLARADVIKSELVESDLTETNLAGADVIKSELAESELVENELEESELEESGLAESELSETDLTKTDETETGETIIPEDIPKDTLNISNQEDIPESLVDAQNGTEESELQNTEINWNDYFTDKELIKALTQYFNKLYPDTTITMEHILEVTELSLNNYYIYDITGISIFRNLTVLKLENAGIYTLPPEIGELSQLEELSLVGCGLYYFPEEMADLTNLKVLKFGGHGTYHDIQRFDIIPNLEELYISDLQFPTMYHEIDFYKRLKVLHLQNVSNIDMGFLLQELPDTQVIIEDMDLYFPDSQFIIEDENLEFIWIHEMPPVYLKQMLLVRDYQTFLEFIEIQLPESMPHENIITGVADEGLSVNYFTKTGIYNLTYVLEEYKGENINLNNIRYNMRIYADIRNSKTPEQMFPDPIFRGAVEEELRMQYGEVDWEKINYIRKLSIPYECEDYTGISYLAGLSDLMISEELLNIHIQEIMRLNSLSYLTITSDYQLELPQELRNMFNLKNLNIYSGSSNLPDVIGEITQLEMLSLEMPNLVSVPENIFHLANLKYLYLHAGAFTELSPNISNLKKLELLSLANLNISSFPEEIGLLPNLESINFNYTKMETLPRNISKIEALKRLNIYNCSLLKQLPEEIGDLANLESLSIRYCKDLQQLPEKIGNLSNLSSIYLYEVGLQSLPESIGRLSNLTSINMESTKLQHLPEEFGELLNLKTLEMNKVPLTEFPDSFGNLENLQKLVLKNMLFVELPDSIGNLSNLKTIQMEGNNKLNCLPASIGNLSKLELLSIRGSAIIELPTTIGNLSSLKEINLSNVNITKFPEEIGNIATLERISVWGGKLKELPKSINGLEKLRSVYVSSTQLTDALPESLFQMSYCSIGSQTVTLDPLEVPRNIPVTCEILLPPLANQIKEKNNGILTGTWTITDPNQQTRTIPAGDGSEILAEMFAELGEYKVIYKSSGSVYTPSYNLGRMSVYQLQYTLPLTITEEEEITLNHIFPDSALAQTIAVLLGKDANEEVTEEELSGIKNLQASQKGIVDLTGIEYLNGLTHLTLSKNQISVLPDGLWTLNNLKLLDLQSNEITELNEGIGNLVELTTLYVQKNKLSSLPDGVGNLVSLKTFYAQDNALIKAVPEACFTIRSGNYTKQSASLPVQSLSAEEELSYEWFLPEFVLQLKEKNNGQLIGEWIIKNPEGTTRRIPAGDGSEINQELFTVSGEYTIQYNVSGSSYSVDNGNIGTLNYSTKLSVE